jgi:hypothetical protein
LDNVVAIAGGGSYSLALKSDGTVAAWGNTNVFQANNSVDLSNVVAIAGGGDYHSLTLKSDGTVAAFGYNFRGETDIPATIYMPAAISGSVNTNTPGTYSLTYTATNFLGEMVRATRTVVVRDTLPPVITFNGPSTIILKSNSFTDPGATAADLCAGDRTVVITDRVNANFPGVYTNTYTAVDSFGHVGVTNRTIVVAALPAVPGDLDGDGLVDQSELNTVFRSYVTDSPWLHMTNVAGLGGASVTFALSNSPAGTLSAEYSTDLVNWLPLGPATPRYLVTDTNAPAGPQRYYRLRYP